MHSFLLISCDHSYRCSGFSWLIFFSLNFKNSSWDPARLTCEKDQEDDGLDDSEKVADTLHPPPDPPLSPRKNIA